MQKIGAATLGLALVGMFWMGCEQKRPEGGAGEVSLAQQRASGVAAPASAPGMGSGGAAAQGVLDASLEAGVPADAVAAYQKAQTLKANGDVAGAIDQYKQAIALHPEFPTAYRALGYAYFQNNQLDEAIAAYQKAIELRPDSAELHTGLSMLYFQTGQMEKATQEQAKAKALGTGASAAHNAAMQSVLPPGHPPMGAPKDASGQMQGELPPGHPPIKPE